MLAHCLFRRPLKPRLRLRLMLLLKVMLLPKPKLQPKAQPKAPPKLRRVLLAPMFAPALLRHMLPGSATELQESCSMQRSSHVAKNDSSVVSP